MEQTLTNDAADEPTGTLSNRGNKLSGRENPGARRAPLWRSTDSISPPTEEEFNGCERSFVRKARHLATTGRNDEEELFLRFVNQFEQNGTLFAKEGINVRDIFQPNNLTQRPLSPHTARVLQSRQLAVLSTLLMLLIEKEQEEYRRLMQLAECLCIDEFRGEGVLSEETGELDTLPQLLTDIDQDELLQLKALCHEHLHAKRVYVSTLRKIRSGTVYSLFQANDLLRRLNRLGSRLARNRRLQSSSEADAEREGAI